MQKGRKVRKMELQDVAYTQYVEEMLQQLPQGAFLSVKSGEMINTMTIGWGAIGYMWRRPVLIVAVRFSRYTYHLMEKATDFSVSFSLNKDLKNSLAEAGKKSGRDIDKFRELNLTARQGKKIDSPVIAECDLVYECQIVFKQPINPDFLHPEIKNKFYADEDYHVLYFGEIVDTYYCK